MSSHIDSLSGTCCHRWSSVHYLT